MSQRDDNQPGRGRGVARTRLTPELRRAQIVEAAIDVFSGRDPAEVTFEEIAEAAGVSRALVYNYFGDRGGLLGAVCLHCFDLLDRAISSAFDPRLSPARQAAEWVRLYLRFALDNPGPWSMIGSAATSHHPAVQQARLRRLDVVAARWGGTAEARLIAAAVAGLLEAAVREHERNPEAVDFDRLVELVGVLTWKGLSQLLPSGAPIAPRVGP